MQVSPHLTFGGQCEAAFRFYQRALGGKTVTMLTYGDSTITDQVPRHGAAKSFMRASPLATRVWRVPTFFLSSTYDHKVSLFC